MLHLSCPTPDTWLATALADFGPVLVDHAHCEHKASVTALSFVSKYPDDPHLVVALGELARDEAGHFARVAKLCIARGLSLGHPGKDPYVDALLSHVRKGNLESRVDRLLCCALIEARSCERMQLLATALPARVGVDPLVDDTIVELYRELWKEEATHHLLFVELAVRTLERAHRKQARDDVAARLQELAAHEGALVQTMAPRAAIH